MGAPKLETKPIDLIAHLRSCAILEGADEALLQSASSVCEHLSFRAGDSIILENEANSAVYFVIKGTVEIASYLAEEKRTQRLVLLTPGQHFGEFSVLTKTSRSSSAHAHDDCELLKMSGAIFLSMIQSSAVVAQNLTRHLARLTDASFADEVIPFYTDGALAITPQILEILPALSWKKHGVVPISMKAGLLHVAVKDPHSSAFFTQISRLFPKLEFAVYLIGERRFDDLVVRAQGALKSPAAKAAVAPLEALDALTAMKRSVPYSSFESDYLQQLLPHVRPVSAKAGMVILARGTDVAETFILLSGSVLLERAVNGTQAVASVTTLRAGDCFGESQAMLGSKAAYSVRAMEDTELIAIPKAISDQLLSHAPFVVDVARSLADKLQILGHIAGLKYVPPNATYSVEAVANRVPLSLIDEEKALPLRLDNGEVTIGLTNADGAQTLLKFERYFADERLKIVGLSLQQFQNFRSRLKSTEASPAAAMSSSSSSSSAPSSQQTAQKVDVLKWIDSVLTAGLQSGASDVHFEPGPGGLATRFRIDGVLREHGRKISSDLVPQVVNRIKVLASMDISTQHLPQDGHLEMNTPSLKMMARVSTLPVKHGEKIVLRLIRERTSIVPIENIAPDRRIVKFLKSMTECRQGLFLVTGPTGSGKTTTLYSLLKVINQIDVNVISVEDPIEMEIAGINQVEINTKRGVDFATVLRSLLRQDPDVVMIGEIRDGLSAKIVSDAAMTGHLVISTLHAGTSFEVIPRLRELGLSSAQIAESLLGVVAQRLVRKICPHCVREDAITPSEADMFTNTSLAEAPATIKRGSGCATCGQTGYVGRLPVFETWGNNAKLRDGIRQDLPTNELQTIAREQGFEHLHEFGLRMVLSGLTTPEEVRRVLTGVDTLG